MTELRDAEDIVSIDEDETTRSHRVAHPCDVCNLVMDPVDWANRHWPHEPGCDGPSTSCTCSLEVHEQCCPVTDCAA